MLTPLSDFAIAFVELIEAEVRAARKGVVKLGVAVVLVILAGVLFLAALTLFLNVLYLWLLGTHDADLRPLSLRSRHPEPLREASYGSSTGKYADSSPRRRKN